MKKQGGLIPRQASLGEGNLNVLGGQQVQLYCPKQGEEAGQEAAKPFTKPPHEDSLVGHV